MISPRHWSLSPPLSPFYGGVMMGRRRRRLYCIGLLVMGLLLGACGKGGPGSPSLASPVRTHTWGLGRITGLALSGDRSTLIVGLTTGILRIQLHTGQPLEGLLPLGEVVALAAQPGASRLAVACSRGCPRLALYAPPDPRPQTTLLPESEPVQALAFSPDGRFLAASGLRVFLWALEPEPALRWTLPLQDSEEVHPGETLAFTPDGQRLLVDEGYVRILSVESGQTVGTLEPAIPGWDVTDLALSPDGRWVAGSDREGITVWDLATGRILHRLVEPYPGAPTWAEGGRLLLSGRRVWDLTTGQPLRDRASEAFVRGGFPLDPGEVIFWAAGMVGVEEARTGRWRSLLETGAGIGGLAFGPDGKTLAYAGVDHQIRVLAVETGQEQERLPLGKGEMYPLGELVILEEAEGWRIWDLRERRAWRMPPGPQGSPSSAAVAPNRSWWAVGTETGEVWVGEVGREGWRWQRKGGPTPVRVLAFAPDGRWLAVGSHRFWLGTGEDPTPLRVWETASGQLICAMQGWLEVMRLAVHPDGQRLLVVGLPERPIPGEKAIEEGKRVEPEWRGEWVNATTCARQAGFPLDEWPGPLAISPDGRYLALPVGETLWIWDFQQGNPKEQAPTWRLEGFSARALAFSPDGRWLSAVMENGQVSLWRMPR